MIEHYVQIRDVQTAAVLCAVFSNRCSNTNLPPHITRKKNSKSETLKSDSLGKDTLGMKKFSRTQSEMGTDDVVRKLTPNPVADISFKSGQIVFPYYIIFCCKL